MRPVVVRLPDRLVVLRAIGLRDLVVQRAVEARSARACSDRCPGPGSSGARWLPNSARTTKILSVFSRASSTYWSSAGWPLAAVVRPTLTTSLAPRCWTFASPAITFLIATSRSSRRFSSAAFGRSSLTAASLAWPRSRPAARRPRSARTSSQPCGGYQASKPGCMTLLMAPPRRVFYRAAPATRLSRPPRLAATERCRRSRMRSRHRAMDSLSHLDFTRDMTTIQPGQTLENPVTGERFTFTDTAATTDGALLAFDFALRPGGAVPMPHVHPIQTERFEVTTGTSWGARLNRHPPHWRPFSPPTRNSHRSQGVHMHQHVEAVVRVEATMSSCFPAWRRPAAHTHRAMMEPARRGDARSWKATSLPILGAQDRTKSDGGSGLDCGRGTWKRRPEALQTRGAAGQNHEDTNAAQRAAARARARTGNGPGSQTTSPPEPKAARWRRV